MTLLKLFDFTERKLASIQSKIDRESRDIHWHDLAVEKDYYQEILHILFKELERE